MRVEQLRKLLTTQPFRPFTIHLPEGRSVPVVHHDFALLSPNGRTLIAYGADDAADIIDVMLITSIQLGPPPASQASSNATIPPTNGPQ